MIPRNQKCYLRRRGGKGCKRLPVQKAGKKKKLKQGKKRSQVERNGPIDFVEKRLFFVAERSGGPSAQKKKNQGSPKFRTAGRK